METRRYCIDVVPSRFITTSRSKIVVGQKWVGEVIRLNSIELNYIANVTFKKIEIKIERDRR